MARAFAVVDGSNVATEGRSTPSLAQLDEAVREFQRQFPDRQVIVVVDATFGHRIDPSERQAFEDAVAHGELISPPAGAIGRGDAFLLRVAERVGAQVLSNDSFQEFHGEHPWLFDDGKLIGATHVPGVGWIFTPRSPVRGPRSRAARAAVAATGDKAVGRRADVADEQAGAKKKGTRTASPPASKTKQAKEDGAKETPRGPAKTKKAAGAAKSSKKAAAKKVPSAAPAKKAAPAKGASKKQSAAKDAPKKAPARSRGGRRRTGSDVDAAIEAATEEVLVPDEASAQSSSAARRRRAGGPPGAVNDPLTFLTFVSEHPIGTSVEGTVVSFTSHGAMVDVGAMHCYAPLKGLGDPPPQRARELLSRGEQRTFVLVALDPPRRGAELALPEFAHIDR